MGLRSISDELSIEDSTSTSYLAAKAEMGDAPAKGQLEEPLPAVMQHQAEQSRSQFGSEFLKVQYAYWDSDGLQMARERWRSIRATRRKP